jgi:Fe-S cluster biogenesis protein NfuA
MVREKVEQALNELRPILQADGGDVSLADVSEDGVVSVELTGACHGCPMSQITLSRGIERTLKARVPEVQRIVAVN